jgi:hypothetical protein
MFIRSNPVIALLISIPIFLHGICPAAADEQPLEIVEVWVDPVVCELELPAPGVTRTVEYAILTERVPYEDVEGAAMPQLEAEHTAWLEELQVEYDEWIRTHGARNLAPGSDPLQVLVGEHERALAKAMGFEPVPHTSKRRELAGAPRQARLLQRTEVVDLSIGARVTFEFDARADGTTHVRLAAKATVQTQGAPDGIPARSWREHQRIAADVARIAAEQSKLELQERVAIEADGRAAMQASGGLRVTHVQTTSLSWRGAEVPVSIHIKGVGATEPRPLPAPTEEGGNTLETPAAWERNTLVGRVTAERRVAVHLHLAAMREGVRWLRAEHARVQTLRANLTARLATVRGGTTSLSRLGRALEASGNAIHGLHRRISSSSEVWNDPVAFEAALFERASYRTFPIPTLEVATRRNTTASFDIALRKVWDALFEARRLELRIVRDALQSELHKNYWDYEDAIRAATPQDHRRVFEEWSLREGGILASAKARSGLHDSLIAHKGDSHAYVVFLSRWAASALLRIPPTAVYDMLSPPDQRAYADEILREWQGFLDLERYLHETLVPQPLVGDARSRGTVEGGVNVSIFLPRNVARIPQPGDGAFYNLALARLQQRPASGGEASVREGVLAFRSRVMAMRARAR